MHHRQPDAAAHHAFLSLNESMNTQIFLADLVSACLGGILSKRSTSECRVLMYHALGTLVPGDVKHLYNMHPNTFKAQLDCLTELSRSDLIRVTDIRCGIHDHRGVAITFDDGYRDNLLIAAPMLIEREMPFTVFVAPGLALSGDERYLTPPLIKELAALPGCTIGAHGYTHRALTTLGKHALDEELRSSRAWLEDITGKPVVTMSYPHGAVCDRVVAAVAEAGFELAASSRFGPYRRGEDLLIIPRLDLWSTDDTKRFKAKLAGKWDWLKWVV